MQYKNKNPIEFQPHANLHNVRIVLFNIEIEKDMKLSNFGQIN